MRCDEMNVWDFLSGRRKLHFLVEKEGSWVTDWVHGAILFCCLCSQDRSQILALLRPAELLTVIGETCVFLSIDSFL